MIFQIAFNVIVAIVVYMVATVLVTEMFKKWLPVMGGLALLLSWAVGCGIYTAMRHFGWPPITLNWGESIIIFLFIMGLTNAAYTWAPLREWVRRIMKTEI
jgi:uncharacterized membrane protein YoaK (UPF0700 family)